MQDAKYLELRKEDQFVGMNPDVDGKPQHYHVWFTEEDIIQLSKGNRVKLQGDQGVTLNVVVNDEYQGSKVEAMFDNNVISMSIESILDKQNIAKLLNDFPKIPVHGARAVLSFMPHYVPGIADYRMQTI